MKLVAFVTLGLVLAASSSAFASSSRPAPSPMDRALCSVGVKSHCLDTATVDDPVIINKRTICRNSGCTDNATTNPAIINKRTICQRSSCTDSATITNPVIINR